MASLQIRDVPDPLHRLLQRRATAQERSLSQQPWLIWRPAQAETRGSGAGWRSRGSLSDGSSDKRWHGRSLRNP